MKMNIPKPLLNPENTNVLKYLNSRSAHSDLGEKLVEAAKNLGDVQYFCSDPDEYGYVLLSTKNKIFGFASGMEIIAFRFNQIFCDRAIRSGGELIPSIGNEWISFNPFRNDWPKPDLEFWAAKAYLYARDLE